MHVSRKVLRKFRSRSKTFSKCMFICCLLVVALFLCALFLSFLFKWIALCSSTSLTLSFLAYTFSCFKFFSSLLHPYLPLCTSHLVLNHQFQPYPLFLHFRSEYAGKCFFTCFSCISHNFSWLLTTWTASQVVHYDACTSYNPLWIPISFFSLSHISCSFSWYSLFPSFLFSFYLLIHYLPLYSPFKWFTVKLAHNPYALWIPISSDTGNSHACCDLCFFIAVPHPLYLFKFLVQVWT